MRVQLLKSKIHKARITEAVLNYEGSLGVDLDLLEAAGMYPYEKLLIVNATNGERLETYAIPAERGSKTFCLNGAAARRGEPGDEITIMSFASIETADVPTHQPRVIVLNAQNEIVKQRGPQ